MASLLRDRSAAEDVTAQAFERAYRKRRSYRARAGHAGGVDVRDRPQRGAGRAAPAQAHARPRDEPEDLAARSVDDAAELSLRREVVRAALAELDGAERDLVALKFAGGLSNAEIARVLGHVRVQRRNTTAPDHDEAEGGLP